MSDTIRGAVVPHALMDEAPIELRPQVCAVYAALQRLDSGVPGGPFCISPVADIARTAGIGQKGARAALDWLVAETWVTKYHRNGWTPIYQVSAGTG